MAVLPRTLLSPSLSYWALGIPAKNKRHEKGMMSGGGGSFKGRPLASAASLSWALGSNQEPTIYISLPNQAGRGCASEETGQQSSGTLVSRFQQPFNSMPGNRLFCILTWAPTSVTELVLMIAANGRFSLVSEPTDS